MNDTSLMQIHNEIDRELLASCTLLEQFEPEAVDPEWKYYAADIIAANYNGTYQKELACVCQSFLYARLLHRQRPMTETKVLLGDYFSGQITGFGLPEEETEAVLEKLAAFVEWEAEHPEEESEEAAKERFGKLFKEVAGGMHE